MADDARPTCERCRRPRAEVFPLLSPDECIRHWPEGRDRECDRLLLAERDALAAAGDALAEDLAGYLVANPMDTRSSLAAWRALRSEEGTGR